MSAGSLRTPPTAWLSRRRLATLASAAAAGLVALLALGTAAGAADAVKVEVRGISSTMTAGTARAFQATFTANGNAVVSGVQAFIAVHLEGASPEMIRVIRQSGGDLSRQSGSGGTVVFADQQSFDLQPGRETARRYTLMFSGSAPEGKATVTVAAVADGQQLGSANASTTVVHGRGQDPRTTAPNTNPGYVPTFEAGPTYSIAPLPVAQQPTRVQASVPKSLYVLGSLLFAMGAASLFLILRPPGRTPARVSGAGPHRVSTPSWHPREGGGPQAWPTVSRPEPPRRGQPEPGAHTGHIRPVREAGPDDRMPPWLRP